MVNLVLFSLANSMQILENHTVKRNKLSLSTINFLSVCSYNET